MKMWLYGVRYALNMDFLDSLNINEVKLIGLDPINIIILKYYKRYIDQ
jgi:hypothetical protein